MPDELKDKEKKRLEKEIEKQTKQVESLKAKLANPNFIERAPEDLVLQTKSNLEESQSNLKELEKKFTLLV